MRVVISAGGSGGHIYPALAIINKIKEEEPNSEFLYIGTHDRMENDIIPKYNIPFKTIEIYGMYRNIFKNIKTVRYFLKGIKKSKKLIKEFNPDIVIGVGGYVTTPVLYAAHKLGYKTFIHEQNSIPGKANKFVANFADRIAVSFPSSKDAFDASKVVITGNPVSDDALKRPAAKKKEFGLDENKKLVLFVMGSQGASTVNNCILESMNKFKNKDYEILFVTGKADFDSINKHKFPDNVKVVPYIDGMTRIMKKTDIIVTRAGASTLSEIMTLGVPSILIPSPYVPNNHQFINAMDLVNSNAAEILEEKDLTSASLVQKIDKLISDEKKQQEMKKNLKSLAIQGSADAIYKAIRELIDRK